MVLIKVRLIFNYGAVKIRNTVSDWVDFNVYESMI